MSNVVPSVGDRWREWSDERRQNEVSPSSMVPGRDISPWLTRYAADGDRAVMDAPRGVHVVAYGDHPDEVISWVPAARPVTVPAPVPGLAPAGRTATISADTGAVDATAHAVDAVSASPAPTVVVIHGGYWQALSHCDGLFAAVSLAEAGFNVASINYSLAPGATLEQIIEQCRRAVGFLVVGDPVIGLVVDPGRLVLSGHSAGGHLAALCAADVPAAALLLFSGVYDLEPLVGTTVNAALGLDAPRARALSPLHREAAGEGAVLMAWGEHDTAHFIDQSRRYGQMLTAAGRRVEHLEVPDTNHFDVIYELADPGSPTRAWLTRETGG